MIIKKERKKGEKNESVYYKTVKTNRRGKATAGEMIDRALQFRDYRVSKTFAFSCIDKKKPPAVYICTANSQYYTHQNA